MIRIVPDLYGPKSRHGLGDAQPAAAGRAAKPDDLARPNGKAHIVEIFAAEAAHFQRERALGRRLSVGGVGEAEAHLLARHRLDERVLGQGRGRRGQDVLRVAQDGHGLTNLVDLLKVVGDEQERHPLRLQPAHLREQALDLLAVQLRCRLVEDDESRAIGKGARDLDQLPSLDLEDRLRASVRRPRRPSDRAPPGRPATACPS